MNNRLFLILGCIFLVGCHVNYYHEKFTRISTFETPNTEYFLRLDASEGNAARTKTYGPWLFSFKASTTDESYTNLVIESAIFTDSKNNQIVLIEPNTPVKINFSSERQPVGEFAGSYYSKDRRPLSFDFYETQELMLELSFFMINEKHEKTHFTKLVKFKANLIKGREKFNIFTDIT